MNEKQMNKIIELYEYHYKAKVDRNNPQFIELCGKMWFIHIFRKMLQYQNDVKQLSAIIDKNISIYDGVKRSQKKLFHCKEKMLWVKSDYYYFLLNRIFELFDEIFEEKENDKN